MPPLLILFCALGALAVVGGNALVVLAARRRSEVAWAFHDAPVGADLPSEVPSSVGHDARAPLITRRAPTPRRFAASRAFVASAVLFGVCFLAYAAIGGVLALHYGSIVGDAYSRVSDAYYVFYSRDPHLAAIGFVWNPLPSLMVMPFFALKPLWPELATRAYAIILLSAAFTAGCVVQFRVLFKELRVSSVSTWVLLALFALNPMIVYYAANGMSEAFYLFFLIVTVRYLMKWLRTQSMAALVRSGCAIGLCYLVRYEAAAAAATAGAIVALVGFARTDGRFMARVRAALPDFIIFIIPFAVAFVGWAVVSYVIVGHTFEQFSSQYGNAAQLAATGGSSSFKLGGFSMSTFGAIQVLVFAPVIPVLLFAVGLQSFADHDPVPLALGVFVAASAFSFLAFLDGSTYPYLRYYLPVVPLAVCCAAVLATRATRRIRSVTSRRAGDVILALAAVVLLIPGMATTAWAMQDKKFGIIEHQYLAWIVSGQVESKSQRAAKTFVRSTQRIASDLDAQHLRAGAVVADTFSPCMWAIVVVSEHPHQFVITSDRDFERTVSDPPTFHARYLIVPENGAGLGRLDALNSEYPDLYKNGASFAKRVKEYDEPGCPVYRLYHITRSPRAR